MAVAQRTEAVISNGGGPGGKPCEIGCFIKSVISRNLSSIVLHTPAETFSYISAPISDKARTSSKQGLQ